jgi:hypothetical protein
MKRNKIVLSLILTAFALIVMVPVVVIGGFVAYSIYRDEVAEPIAKQKVPEVKNEFRQIPALAGAIATTNDGFTFDPQHLTEGRLYRTNLTDAEIRAHYDAELSKSGKFDREADVNGVDGRTTAESKCFTQKVNLKRASIIKVLKLNTGTITISV